MTDSGRRIRSCDKGRLESDTFYTWEEIDSFSPAAARLYRVASQIRRK